MTAASEPAIRVFLSYAHADDLVLEFIEPFTRTLKHLTFADHGRTIDFFVDRDSIGWGEDWQASIRSSIDGAMIFMPVVTRQYFDRPACREELLTFYSEAKQLGVTELLLPVVVLGHAYISEDSQDVVARIIHERQYRDLKEAWLEGVQSSTWRRKLMSLAAELVEAAGVAEQALVADGQTRSTALQASGDSDEDAPGVAEVGEALDTFEEEVEQLMAALSESMDSFTSMLSDTDKFKNSSRAELRKHLLELAVKLRPVGIEFQERGREFESVALRTDEIMRSYMRFLRDNELSDQLKKEQESLSSLKDSMGNVVGAESAVSDFLENLRPLEVGSAPFRKSIRGFRDGAKSIKSGLAIMQSWQNLAEE